MIPNVELTKANRQIIEPYFIKDKKLKSSPCFFSIDIHMIPAKAPIGVKQAPILDPMTVENRAISLFPSKINEYKTDIGMLFMRLSNKVEEILQAKASLYLFKDKPSKKFCKQVMTPFAFKAQTKTNIERIKGIRL